MVNMPASPYPPSSDGIRFPPRTSPVLAPGIYAVSYYGVERHSVGGMRQVSDQGYDDVALVVISEALEDTSEMPLNVQFRAKVRDAIGGVDLSELRIRKIERL